MYRTIRPRTGLVLATGTIQRIGLVVHAGFQGGQAPMGGVELLPQALRSRCTCARLWLHALNDFTGCWRTNDLERFGSGCADRDLENGQTRLAGEKSSQEA